MAHSSSKLLNARLLLIGIIGFVLFCVSVDLVPGKPQITYMAGVALLMAFLWVTEAIPIGVTSLLPILLYPLLGIMDGKLVSSTYINDVIFLFFGGFIMALAIEHWNLHRRMALAILMTVGGKPMQILFGFMTASAFLSMWMSNTATAMMMLPIAISVLNSLADVFEEKKIKHFSVGLLLSIAFACSLGGVATLVGTPPNLSLVRIFEIIYPNAPQITFGQWIIFALPMAVCIFLIMYVYLYILYVPKNADVDLSRSFFKKRYKNLGPISFEQKVLFILFMLLIVLWVFRRKLEIGTVFIPGWSEWLHTPKFLNDGTVAIFIALCLFMIPSKNKKGEALMSWELTKRMPWDIILLFGGGFALAKGFIDSGLSAYIGGLLKSAGSLSDIGLIATASGLMSILTEFTSNTATTEMMLPVISGLATEIHIHPLLLMIPITLAASMAFMFPIATPPNAIVFGSGRISVKQMLFTGFFLNIIAVIIITLFTYFWLPVAFNVDLSIFPEWADITNMKH